MTLNKIQFLFSPLEHFEITPYFFLTNMEISELSLFILANAIFSFSLQALDSDGMIVPSRFQIVSEDLLFGVILFMTRDNIGLKNGQAFFPQICNIFLQILLSNLLGTVPQGPGSFSQIIMAGLISTFFFLALNFLCSNIYGKTSWIMFLPMDMPVEINYILTPIEFISYNCRALSLSIRLFANNVGGHTLLQVIAGFTFFLMKFTGLLSLSFCFPLLFMVILCFLETAVAFIQAYVFCTLVCIYIEEVLYLH